MQLCEFHVPISPTPSFLHQVHFLAASIEMFSGLAPSEYRIVVSVGDRRRVDLDELCPWARDYPIEWRWVEPELFESLSYFATGNVRLCYRYETPAIILLDADILIVGRLREFIEQVAAGGCFHALPAFASPFLADLGVRGHREWWREIYRATEMGEPVFDMRHSGWGVLESAGRDPELEFSPFYPNYGFVAARGEVLGAIGGSMLDELRRVKQAYNSAFKAQIALGLIVQRERIPWSPLPLAYNFLNIQEFFSPGVDIRVLHYGQPFEIDKHRDFVTYGHVELMLERDGLQPVNAFLADRLRDVYRSKVREDLRARGIAVQRPSFDRWQLERQRDRARRAVDAGRLDEARALLEEIIDRLSDDAHANYLLAFVLQSLGDRPDRALDHYDRAFRLGFDEFWVCYNRGALLASLGRAGDARVTLERAAVLNPEHAGVRQVLDGLSSLLPSGGEV